MPRLMQGHRRATISAEYLGTDLADDVQVEEREGRDPEGRASDRIMRDSFAVNPTYDM